jgi:flavin-binding protein dodecin
MEDQSNHVFKQIELVGSSPDGVEAAVTNALERATKSLRNLRWFEVVSVRGGIEDNKIREWQVTLKVAFALD